MKIVCTADLHLGVSSYGRIDPSTNLNTRVLKALIQLDEMIDYTIKNNIKVVCIAGDVYKNSSVPSSIQTEFNKRIRKLLDRDTKVIIIDGNHDVDKINTKKSPLAVYDDLKINNAIQTRFHEEVEITVDGETVKFVLLPTYHDATMIEDIVNNTQYNGNPIVYVLHTTIKGAALNDWNIAEKETYVDAEIFDKPGVAAVVMGHLHKHQTLYNKPLVFYTGSLQRVDFSEEHQPKGFVVLDVNQDSTVEYEFIELESQKFCTLNIDLLGEQNETDLIIDTLNVNKFRVKNAIVRIRVDLDKSNSFNEKRIYDHAYSLGAENVLDIQKRYEKRQSVRNADLTQHIDEVKAVELWSKDKYNADQLVELAKDIISKMKKEGKL